MIFPKRTLALTAFLLLASPALGRPSLYQATPTEEQATASASAQQYMDEGAARYAKADWAGAHVAFLKAWEIVQHRAVATNLADVELRLGLYVQAAERLKYLISTLPGDHEDEVSALETQLAECRRHATSIRVTSDVEDAKVRINGKDMGKVSSLSELIVEPGPTIIVLSRPGYKDVQRRLFLASGESRTLDFDLEPVVATPAPKLPVPAPHPVLQPPIQKRSGFGAREVVALGGLTLTLTAGVIGVVYWRKAENAYDRAVAINEAADIASDGCRQGKEVDVAACRDLRETIAKGDRNVDIMRGAYITAGALGVVTVVTYLLWPAKSSSKKMGIAPWSTTGGGGATVWGQF